MAWVLALLADVTAGPRIGGKPMAGFQIELFPVKGALQAGQDLILKFRVRNLSRDWRTFPKIRVSDITVPRHSFKDQASQGRVEFKQISGRKPGGGGGQGRGGRNPEIEPVDIRPGGSFRDEIAVDTRRLLPGEYDVKIVYYAKTKGLLPAASDDLVSDTIRVVIKENE